MAVTIFPNDRDDARRVAGRLLAAAGVERHDEVRTCSEGVLGLAFVVPDDLAQRVFGVAAGGAGGDGVVAAQGGSDAPGSAPAEAAAAVSGDEPSGQAAQRAGRSAGARRGRGR